MPSRVGETANKVQAGAAKANSFQSASDSSQASHRAAGLEPLTAPQGGEWQRDYPEANSRLSCLSPAERQKVERFEDVYRGIEAGEMTAERFEKFMQHLRGDKQYRLADSVRALFEAGMMRSSSIDEAAIYAAYRRDRRAFLIEEGYSKAKAGQIVNLEEEYIRKQVDEAPQMLARVRQRGRWVMETLDHVVEHFRLPWQVTLVGEENCFKSIESLKRKLITKMTENPQRGPRNQNEIVRDAMRFTVIFPQEGYRSAYDQFIEQMNSFGYQAVEVDAKWPERDAVWLGTNVTFQEPLGVCFEVQFHTPETHHGNRLTHWIYEHARLGKLDDALVSDLRQIRCDITDCFVRPMSAAEIPQYAQDGWSKSSW